MKLWTAILTAVGLSATLSHPASAAAPAAQPAAMANLMACRAIADPSARLACFDRESGALEAADNSGEVVVLDRRQIQEARREVFGFTLPPLSKMLSSHGQAEPALDQIQLTVDHAYENGEGKWVLAMQDGQIWRAIENQEFLNPPRHGDVVTIRRAMLGSFTASFGREHSFKVHRDQ